MAKKNNIKNANVGKDATEQKYKAAESGLKELEAQRLEYEKLVKAQQNFAKENQKLSLELQKRLQFLEQENKNYEEKKRLLQDYIKSQDSSIEKIRKERKEQQKTRNEIKKSVESLDDYESAIRSIGSGIGNNNKLFETSKVYLDSQKTTLKSVGMALAKVGKSNKKLTDQANLAVDKYKEMYVSIARTQKDIKNGKKTWSEYREEIVKINDEFDGIISKIDASTEEGKKFIAILKGMKDEMGGFATSSEKSTKQFELLESSIDNLGSSGIPLMSELGDVVKSVAEGGKGATMAFTALGAAVGYMLGKTLPGLADMNAKLRAGNDILESQIDLKRELAKLSIEAGFIPEKIFQERLQNSVETANEINRAMIDAQYAAERAANSFNASLLSGAAQFRAAAKTARSGDILGPVRYSVAQLQLAGISAEQISDSMNEVSALMGKMPTEEVASDISVFAKQAGIGADEVAQIADSMNLIDGYSLQTSLNLQEGIKAMARRSGVSFSKLMKGVAAASKKMLEYGIMNSKQLVKQVAYVQSIGADFNQINDAGRNMVLNYKDSIKAEMKLSAILGKQVDFSEARQAFFEGRTEDALESIRAQGLTKEDLRSPFAQEAVKEAMGGMDFDSILKAIDRTGRDSGELQSKSIIDGNNKFLKRFESAQRQLSAEEAVISANQVIIDAELSGKITDAYLNSEGYLKYQQSLNVLQQLQAKLTQSIEEAFMASKGYTDYLVAQERLQVRRDLTENLIPALSGLGGGMLFNYLGGKMFGGGTGAVPDGGTTGAASFFSKKAAGTNVAFGNVAGAGFGSNLSGALKSGGTITGGVISGLTSGFMEFSENKKLGISMGENIGRTTTKAISAGVGGWGGASLGAAIGTAIFPGVGTLVGGLIGGWLGGKGGDKLGDAINGGIWGDKQRKQLTVQETMQQAQDKLQKDTAMGIQVDVDYYKKSLKLNEEQISQLQQYNKQAVSAEWLKNPPAWYLKSGGRDTTAETYSGSGIKLLKGTYAGDPNVAKYGVDVKYDQFGKATTSIIKQQEYLDRFYKETGQRLSKAELNKKTATGQQFYTAEDPIIQRMLAGNKTVKPEAAAMMAIKDLKDPEWRKKEEKARTESLNKLSFEMTRMTSDNTRMNKIMIEKSNQLGTYANSPALSVSLWGDNIGLVKVLKEILITTQSTANNTFRASLYSSASTMNSFTPSRIMPSFGLGAFGFATGKRKNQSGGMAMVGEKGPELMYVPDSASIVPNGDTNRIKSGDVSKLSKWGVPGYGGGKKGKKGKAEKVQSALTPAAKLTQLSHAGHHISKTGGLVGFSHLAGYHPETDEYTDLARTAGGIIHGQHHLKHNITSIPTKAASLYQDAKTGKMFSSVAQAGVYNTAKSLGKNILHDALFAELLVLETGVAIISAIADTVQKPGQHQNSLTGEDASIGRSTANAVHNFGMRSYAMFDDALFGGISKLLDIVGFMGLDSIHAPKIKGLDAAETARMRNIYFTSNPNKSQSSVSDIDLSRWFLEHSNILQQNEVDKGAGTDSLAEMLTSAVKIEGAYESKRYGKWRSSSKDARKINFSVEENKKFAQREAQEREKAYKSQQSAMIYNQTHLDNYKTQKIHPNIKTNAKIEEEERQAANVKKWEETLSMVNEYKQQQLTQKQRQEEARQDLSATPHQRAAFQMGARVPGYGVMSNVKYLDDKTAKAYLKSKGIQQLVVMVPAPGFENIAGAPTVQKTIPAYATGTNFAPGGISLVGERGPELVNLPRGSEVIPNHKLSSFANGTIGATSTLMNANSAQMEKFVTMLANAITNNGGNGQNINLVVDGRQLANVTYKRTQNRMGMRPNDVV